MARFGWAYGSRWGHYYAEHEQELDRSKVEDAAKVVLARVTKGEAWTDPHGTEHIPLLDDGALVGNLWDDVDPTKLEVATYWDTPSGVKVELSHNRRVVGTVWVAV